MYRTLMDSKALYILRRVNAQLPKTGRLRILAKAKPRAVSSLGRIATLISFNKVRTAA